MVIPLKLLVHSQFSKSQGGLETWGYSLVWAIMTCIGMCGTKGYCFFQLFWS